MTRQQRQERTYCLWRDVQSYLKSTGVPLRKFARLCGLDGRALEAISAGRTKELNDTKINAIEKYLEGKK